MKQKRRLSTQLSAGIALLVLTTIFIISLAANLCINYQFEKYMEAQQKNRSKDIAEGLSRQYDADADEWNLDYIHGYGMYALNEGYILKVYDKNHNMVWDAENHDMTLCHQVMENIRLRMEENRPQLEGDFVTCRYDLEQSGERIGYAEVSYYSPYYMDEDDFHFLESLNQILFVIGILSIAGAVAAGMFLARRITKPITKTMELTREISEGNYTMRFESDIRTKELQDLTQSINHMANALEEQETLRKRLTTDVAHELRTPLTNVSTHLEMMIEGVWEPTPERLQNCYDEIGRITGLVSDLERLRQIESENLELKKEPVNLFSLAQEVCALFEAELGEKHLSCQVEGEAVLVDGDKQRLQQVVVNLLSNAVKFTGVGGRIHILVRNREEGAALVIEDNGIGIPKEDLPLIFERFYRTDYSRSRKSGGAGIGLTIAKAIAQAHGGSLTVESEEGKGSRFTLLL